MNPQPEPVFDHGNYLMSGAVIAALTVIFVAMLAPRDNAVLWAAAYFPLIALHIWLLTRTCRIRVDGDALSATGLLASNRWRLALAAISSAELQPPGLKRGAAWQIRVTTAEGEKRAFIARMSPLRMQQLQKLLQAKLGERYHAPHR
jgi:hypothetical protein